MKIKGFTKLSIKDKEDEYGGWAWLATAVPLFLQTIMTAVTTYKMLESDKGSIKYDGTDAKPKTSTTKSTPTHTFYAF